MVLQLVGSKEWKVYETVPVPYPYPGEEAGKDGNSIPQQVLDGRLCIDVTLQPGDVLYMPRGFVHEARSPTNALSFHVTIALATHDWSLAGVISSETTRIMKQLVNFRPSILPLFDKEGLQTQVDTAMTMIREQITAESIINNLNTRIESHNERAFTKRMNLIQNARFPPETSQPKSSVGPEAASKVTYTSTIRAATEEERASVVTATTTSKSPRGLNVREEIGDSVMSIITALKTNPTSHCKISHLSSLLPSPNNPQLCDLSLLCLAKRCIELGALAVVS